MKKSVLYFSTFMLLLGYALFTSSLAMAASCKVAPFHVKYADGYNSNTEALGFRLYEGQNYVVADSVPKVFHDWFVDLVNAAKSGKCTVKEEGVSFSKIQFLDHSGSQPYTIYLESPITIWAPDEQKLNILTAQRVVFQPKPGSGDAFKGKCAITLKGGVRFISNTNKEPWQTSMSDSAFIFSRFPGRTLCLEGEYNQLENIVVVNSGRGESGNCLSDDAAVKIDGDYHSVISSFIDSSCGKSVDIVGKDNELFHTISTNGSVKVPFSINSEIQYKEEGVSSSLHYLAIISKDGKFELSGRLRPVEDKTGTLSVVRMTGSPHSVFKHVDAIVPNKDTGLFSTKISFDDLKEKSLMGLLVCYSNDSAGCSGDANTPGTTTELIGPFFLPSDSNGNKAIGECEGFAGSELGISIEECKEIRKKYSPDPDGDGVTIKAKDNCPSVANPDQKDSDGDGIGDACDEDIDGDGFNNDDDKCPDLYTIDNVDMDGDGIGDACDEDKDGDDVPERDNCPDIANSDQLDADGDGTGDLCETDGDEDGIIDDTDNCPMDINPDQTDSDKDGIGDLCDPLTCDSEKEEEIGGKCVSKKLKCAENEVKTENGCEAIMCDEGFEYDPVEKSCSPTSLVTLPEPVQQPPSWGGAVTPPEEETEDEKETDEGEQKLLKDYINGCSLKEGADEVGKFPSSLLLILMPLLLIPIRRYHLYSSSL